MKAEIYKVPAIGCGWYWKIKIDDFEYLTGYAFTRRGAEYAARRTWKKYNKPITEYKIELDK
jgi:hypothetical protein